MSPLSPKRRPADGGYARGEETRLRIIDAAIRLFGRQGFDGASTREIAAEAGVNPPALQYYFSSKEGLYAACAEHIAQGVVATLEPVMERAERLLREGAPAQALIEAYCSIIEAAANLLLCQPEAGAWSPLLAREEAGLGPDVAFRALREHFIDKLHDVCAGLLGKLTGMPADSAEIRLKMAALKGPLLVFHIGRRGTLACLGWDDFSPEQGRYIKALIIDHTRTLLTEAHRRAVAEGKAAANG
jgi:TetR/AcrR family transcriptional regulator, regulator of cefoperazone and chloramphenicol sensitivity